MHRYEDERFNQAVDRSTGYRTRTILCMPVKGQDGTVIAVIQLINKATGVFTEEDEDMMNSFLTIAAPILEVSSRLGCHHRPACFDLRRQPVWRGLRGCHVRPHNCSRSEAPSATLEEVSLKAGP